MTMPTNWADPCEAVALLRPAYFQLLAGAAAASTRFENREVRFAASDIEKLRNEIGRLEAACAAKRGEAKPMTINVRSKGWS